MSFSLLHTPPERQAAAAAARRRDLSIRRDPVEERLLALPLDHVNIVGTSEASRRAELRRLALGQIDLEAEEGDGVKIKLELSGPEVELELPEKFHGSNLADVDAVGDLHRRRVERLRGFEGKVRHLSAPLLLRLFCASGEDKPPRAVEIFEERLGFCRVFLAELTHVLLQGFEGVTDRLLVLALCLRCLDEEAPRRLDFSTKVWTTPGQSAFPLEQERTWSSAEGRNKTSNPGTTSNRT